MWFLSPSGWPTHAEDGSDHELDLVERGYTAIDEADVQAARDAYNAGSPPALDDVVTVGEIEDPASPASVALRAASVSAVEDATTVAPAGAWDFAQAPTVAGVPIGTDGSVTRLAGARPFAEPAIVGTRPFAIFVGVDETDGLIFYADQSGLYTSADGGATLSANKTGPNSGQTNYGNNIRSVIRAGGYLYCQVRNAGAGGIAEVWRAAPVAGDTAYAWTKVLAQTTGSSASFYGHLATDGAAIVAVDYGDPKTSGVNTAKIWRTLVSDGLTWTAVYTAAATVRHFHAVAADPYHPGRFLITQGDGQAVNLLKSDDSGATWSDVPAAGTGYQSVDISFTPDHCYLASDTSRSDGFLLDRETLTNIRHVSTSDHRGTPLPRPGFYGSGGTITSGSTTMNDYFNFPFLPDDVGRRITGPGIPIGTTIAGFTDVATITLSAPATASASSSLAYTIERPEQFAGAAFYGAVDPDTGIYYFLANDADGTESYPIREALFYVTPGGRSELLDPNYLGRLNGVRVHNGHLYYGRHRRPLLTLAD